MRNFLKRNMAVATIMLSFSGVSHVANAQDGYQDLNELDAVINNLIKVSQQTPPPVISVGNSTAQQVHQPVLSAQSVQKPSTAATYSNPFLNSRSASSSTPALSASASSVRDGSAPAIMAAHAMRNALNKSAQRCALYVRRALQAAGYNVTPQASAYMYNNGEMAKLGFKKIPTTNYRPQVGDVVVFNRTPKNPHGHIQIYSGSQWVSDFKQPGMMIYGENHRGYTIWRDRNHVDASMQSDPMYLAMNN